MTIGDWISLIIGATSIAIAIRSLKDTERSIKRNEKQSKFLISMRALRVFNYNIWPKFQSLEKYANKTDKTSNYKRALDIVNALEDWSMYFTYDQVNRKLIKSLLLRRLTISYQSLRFIVKAYRRIYGNKAVIDYIAMLVSFDIH